MTRAPAPFRFGVVAPVLGSVAAWRDQVRAVADLGYSTILVPDVPGWQPAPAPALAVAATLTDLRVGTWVHASPLRPARMLAHEAHSLSELTEGRFDLGLGTGRPGIADLVRELGLPAVGPGERLDRIRETVRVLRELDGDRLRTPVAMAVRGPRACALAAELADVVTFSITAADERAEIEQLAREIRAHRDVVLALHVSVVGDDVAPFMAGPDTDPAELRGRDSLSYLPSDPSAAVDELQRRRETGGFSYVVVGASSAAAVAPVVSRLADR